jgi:hypothetical protein
VGNVYDGSSNYEASVNPRPIGGNHVVMNLDFTQPAEPPKKAKTLSNNADAFGPGTAFPGGMAFEDEFDDEPRTRSDRRRSVRSARPGTFTKPLYEDDEGGDIDPSYELL